MTIVTNICVELLGESCIIQTDLKTDTMVKAITHDIMEFEHDLVVQTNVHQDKLIIACYSSGRH